MSDLHATTAQRINDQIPLLTQSLLSRQAAESTNFKKPDGEHQQAVLRRAVIDSFRFLSESIATKSPALFNDHLAWSKVALLKRSIPERHISAQLELMLDLLPPALPEHMRTLVRDYLTAGLEQWPVMPTDIPSLILRDPLGELAQQYSQALLACERQLAGRIVHDAIEQGTSIKDIYIHVFQRSLHEIGRLWQTDQISAAQEHCCTAATQVIMSQLYPLMFSGEKGPGRLVATAVAGDLHEIGVRMVSDFFEMAGWNTTYLGASTPTEDIVEMLVQHKPQVLAVSATMTPHVRAAADVISAVRAMDDCRRVNILVGGYPFNVDQELWRRIGADGYAPDAQEGIAAAERWLEAET